MATFDEFYASLDPDSGIRGKQYDKFQIAEIMDKRKQGLGYGSIAKSLGMKKSTVQMIVQREVAA